ncbi:laminin subunit beta-1-like [Amphibalanus amphitrite]|uniref:laminin subunit beta-1-like n=1 Tax=Amphibalanus amphitrite TaxID=1232801 RepID=UPI001C901CF3|nr:laminin subunit beta-1-like [Amphibalanus amphitrite]XP_043223098.1 laminin subunit beta-1-like [Amphibalanus amphitrite]XP_043223099.1 laminin subunit beta-1-like [Amphibalanus amphitrite]XP_043223100.1 laminin subunit beta-1-like [Amphibalanus amphitrite]XP_043223101.1 laminin subunit beta-1-like [Amphibalanus amphitrite]XP_043223102.1 laminin subunit beta-1-like [Amphibalanus amphitrite]
MARWVRIAVVAVVLVLLVQEAAAQQTCERGSCLPASGNLLIGREERLQASSTCGNRRRERYCIVSHLEERKKCFWCDSRPQTEKKLLLNHQIKHAVGATKIGPKGYRRLTWWQAENGMEKVQIQLDLEAEFHFTHLIMRFKTFRPKAMVIERSYDFGETWHVYRYFADRCAEEFPDVYQGSPRTMSEVVCQERYSRVEPSSRGEVIFRALPPRLTPANPYSDEVQNLLKITNLRINFTRLHTLGDDLLDHRNEIKEKYYYAIYEMVVAGRCSCYGHAPRCLPLPGVDPVPEMVHGRCECIHNTQGLNCERCLDFHHDLPWKPAVGKETNACKRCNCHNHSDRCHFDPARFNQTGFVSGGVCDDCRDNTEGYNCEQCKTGFYQVPGLDLRDPNICRECECDPRGSLYDGICESKATDTLPAGHCHCKEKVGGARCDRCQPGYWNFTAENPAGCQECTCDPLGSLPDIGCDELTGHCRCKRHVVGRNCDQCPEQYWGLSDHPDGCKPCSCDPGGAYDNTCDVITGQCRCRPNLAGRTCSEPQENFYGGLLDYLVYEAETARTDERSQTMVREPYRDGRRTSWTGPGFTRVFQNSFIEFDIDNIERSMDYDLVVRYEPQSAAAWDNVRMTLIRDPEDPIDPAGQCGAMQPGADEQRLILLSDRRHVTGFPPICLEKGKRYKVRLEFEPFADADPSRNIGTLIDSIALIPRVAQLPMFSGSAAASLQKQEFDHYRCDEYFYQAYGREDMPEACRKHMASIGYYVFEGAKDKECGCDPTGSESTLCDPLGGQCRCKPNVVGRRCDQCAPGTYGFGPEGCTACDCNAVGSLDNFCDRTTGQCKCRPNTYGRSCDECQPGFWNYPDCQRCDCNGHAPTCEPRTGICIDCADNTAGHHCQVCQDTYYGDPRLGVDIPCRPCPCPDTVESGHSFADRCYLDPTTESVLCECREGHAGTQCDVCADNYFGNPEEPGGSCQQCDCSNNVDPSRPGNCDPSTGECLQCLFNTAGFACERCADGYYGDAVERTCQQCVCNILGTDATAGPCDPGTGQCHCLANVMGNQCDRCIPNHWKIAIGDGCEPCACDPVGSSDDQCNEYDGQCVCRPGFGGRRCDQCQDNHWGNPRVQCFPCQCNPYGSAEMQCDRETGRCPCKEGMGGDKCDQCARGFKGRAPYCDACGECFDNWDRILTELRDRTEYLRDEASKIQKGGASGAYQREFREMQEWLDGVREMLGNATVSDDQVDRLQANIDQVRSNLTESERMLAEIGDEVDDVTQRVLLAELKVPGLRGRADSLRAAALALEQNVTLLREADVDGALSLTRDAQRRSEAAEFSVTENERQLAESERQRRRTENLLSRAGQQFNQSQDSNQQLIDSVNQKLSEFERDIPGINSQVCGGEGGDPCDSLCGGAGCGKCGGLACEGAKTVADSAFTVAEKAATTLTEREREVDELLRGVTMAKRAADEANSLAQMAFTGAELNHNRTETTKQRVSELLVQIDEFLSEGGASPQAIRDLARETQEMSISLRPEKITELARQINETIASLTNIQGILDDTAEDLATANALKRRADDAKAQAEQILQTAQSVMTALERAASAQDAARAAMGSAETSIEQAEADLTSIASETGEAQRQANESLVTVSQLRDRQQALSRQFSKNELDVGRAVKEAASAGELADRAQGKVAELEKNYEEAIALLRQKEQDSGSARERAQRLLERASSLSLRANGQVEELREMNSEFMVYETRLRDLSDEVMALNQEMEQYLNTITTRAEYYRTCQS